MGHNKLHHCMLGLTATVLALITILCLQIPSMMKIALLVIAIIGFLWAWVIGHAWMVIPALAEVPFAFLAYFFLSPVKVTQGRAFKDKYEILAYCRLPYRIIIVCEFPTLDSIEGQSLFLPKKVFTLTQDRLVESAASEISIDKNAAEKVFGGPLPDLCELDCNHMEQNVVDSIHRRVGILWSKHKTSNMRENLLHLAAWYSVAADKCYKSNWLDRAIL